MTFQKREMCFKMHPTATILWHFTIIQPKQIKFILAYSELFLSLQHNCSSFNDAFTKYWSKFLQASALAITLLTSWINHVLSGFLSHLRLDIFPQSIWHFFMKLEWNTKYKRIKIFFVGLFYTWILLFPVSLTVDIYFWRYCTVCLSCELSIKMARKKKDCPYLNYKKGEAKTQDMSNKCFYLLFGWTHKHKSMVKYGEKIFINIQYCTSKNSFMLK